MSDSLTAYGKPVAAPLFKLETGKLFSVSTPDGLISETGVDDLQNYLWDIGAGDLPPGFEPVWCTNRGTLPKRLTSHIYKTHKIKLTPAQVSEIGNIAKCHTSTAETYILDFTNSIDWSEGAFGDSGSCYWGSNSAAKSMIEDNGGFAVRLWKTKHYDTLEYRNLRGYARAWIVPIDSGKKLVLFNGYGETSLTISRILSVKFACSYKKINLSNNGCSGGLLYINRGSFILGQSSEIETIAAHDLHWDDAESDSDEDNSVYCHVCGECVGDYDSDYSHAFSRVGHRVAVCDCCYFTCESCEESFVNGLDERIDGSYYCRHCAEALREQREREAYEDSLQESEAH